MHRSQVFFGTEIVVPHLSANREQHHLFRSSGQECTGGADRRSATHPKIFNQDHPLRLTLEGPAGPERLLAEAVTGPFFAVTGIRPSLGRAFRPEEAPAAVVAVLGHDLWADRFAADPGVIGRTVSLDGRALTVVGVAPEGVTSRRFPVQPISGCP